MKERSGASKKILSVVAGVVLGVGAYVGMQNTNQGKKVLDLIGATVTPSPTAQVEANK